MLINAVVSLASGSRSTASKAGRTHGSNLRSKRSNAPNVSLTRLRRGEPVSARGCGRLVLELTVEEAIAAPVAWVLFFRRHFQGEVDQRLTESLSSLDRYQVLATQSVLFPISRSALSPEATKQLDEAAAEALKHTRYVIEVQGFTDKTGAPDANLALSRQRADEVVRYLTMQHKIPLYRIYQLGAGAMLPVADDNTREGRKQNRRVEVKVYSADSDGKKVTASASGR